MAAFSQRPQVADPAGAGPQGTGVRIVGFARTALDFALKLKPRSVLDIGAGRNLTYTKRFLRAGSHVTAVDFVDIEFDHENLDYRQVLFDDYKSDKRFDLVWCSHVMEHMPNTGLFLEHLLSLTGDWLFLTVPPMKRKIVGGHVALFNAGLVMYRLVLAGQDCKKASVFAENYGITVVVRRKKIKLPSLAHDRGDIETLSPFLPRPCRQHGFDGNIEKLNWPPRIKA